MLQNFNKTKETIVSGNDSIVIQKYMAGLTGGRTLDVEAYTEDVLPAGLVIVVDAEGVYAPLAMTEADGKKTYNALPAGAAYAGVLYRTILKKEPAAAIMTAGVVNGELLPAPLPAGAFPNILVTKDIVA